MVPVAKATAKWRSAFTKDPFDVPLDTRGTMYDGMQITKPADLVKSLTSRPLPLLRNFTENLMAYAIGRRMEDHDQTTIRAIVREAEKDGYRMSAFISGVVKSPAFRTMRAEAVTEGQN